MKLMQTIHSFDVHLFAWVMRRKTQKLQVRLARWISHSADGYLHLAFALWLVRSDSPADFQLLGALGLALLMERPLYFVLKNVCRRDRPPVSLKTPSFIVPSDRFSFPSGHTSAAFLLAVLVGTFHPGLAPALLLWSSLVGMSRVILGVHFPTDTLIGALMGTVTAFISLEILLA
jgi:undecaprenyl-diphosphatase